MEERTYQGQIYRRAGPGEAWTLVGPSQQQYRPVNVGGADPRIQGQTTKTNADAQAAAAAAPYAGASAAAQLTGQTLTNEERQQKIADAERERTEAERKQALSVINQDIGTSALMETLNRARAQIGRGWSTGNVAGSEWFQGAPFIGQSSTNLAKTLEGLQGKIINDTLSQLKALSPTGASGFGSLTEREAARLAAAVASLGQVQDSNELLRSLATVEKHYRNTLALSNEEDPRDPAVAEKYGIIPAQNNEGEIPGARGRVTAEGNNEDDPSLRGLNAQVSRMIRDGRSADEIKAYLDKVRPGLGSNPQGLEATIQRARQNPDETPRVELEKNWQPASGISQTLGEIGMSAPGSAVIGAADTVTGGYLDNLTGNPELTRATMEGVSQENPWAYFGGQVAGGAAGALGAEALLGRAGLGAIGRMRGGDFLTGALYGSGSADEPDDSRASQALLGGTLGLGGGMAGRTAARGIGTLATGVADPLVQALDRAGVSMTPGQILGGGLKTFEDKMTSLPIVGNQIGARRNEGIEDFNRAAFQEASDALGVPMPQQLGGAGIEELRAGRSQRYGDLLDNQNFALDAQFPNDIAQLLASSGQLPGNLPAEVASSLEGRIGNAVTDVGGQDMIPGRNYQRALRGIDRDIRSLMKDSPVMGDVAEDLLRGGRDALLGVVERQAPGVAGELSSINRGNMLMETLRSGVNTARNQGEMVMPSQLSTAASQSARRFGNNQGTTQQPFYDLVRAGQAVLPSSYSDSGTAGRLAIPAAAFLAGGGGGYAASEGDAADRAGSGATGAVIASLLAAAPYSPAARAGIQRILVSDRPDAFKRVGDVMINNDTIAGLLAAPASYVPLMTDR